MSTNTNNYKLIKPAQEDFYNVDDFNNNADIIDSQLKAISDKAAAALPESSYTAADILNKLKTVDGNGSGLDADLFKGQSIIPVVNGGTGKTTAREAYRNLAYGGHTREITDFNIYVDSGYFILPGSSANSPISTSYWIMLEVLAGKVDTTYMIEQTATVIQSTSASVARKKYYRHCYSSSTNNWGDWIEIVTTNNISTMMNTALQSGGVSVVKSIQRGGVIIPEGELEASATITAVNRDKAVVLYGGTSADYDVATSCIQLLSSTKVTASRNSQDPNEQSYVPYQVIEFY